MIGPENSVFHGSHLCVNIEGRSTCSTTLTWPGGIVVWFACSISFCFSESSATDMTASTKKSTPENSVFQGWHLCVIIKGRQTFCSATTLDRESCFCGRESFSAAAPGHALNHTKMRMLVCNRYLTSCKLLISVYFSETSATGMIASSVFQGWHSCVIIKGDKL